MTTDVDDHVCGACGLVLRGPDTCADDIELGICHAACLKASPVVDIETGQRLGKGAQLITYRYDERGLA